MGMMEAHRKTVGFIESKPYTVSYSVRGGIGSIQIEIEDIAGEAGSVSDEEYDGFYEIAKFFAAEDIVAILATIKVE